MSAKQSIIKQRSFSSRSQQSQTVLPRTPLSYIPSAQMPLSPENSISSHASLKAYLNSSHLSSSVSSPATVLSLTSPSVTLMLESLNDTFPTKRIKLVDGEPVKIGRTSNKYTNSETNGCFDSKVLSRTHAEVWNEHGKVFIKDLRSSNGTYVNGRRISLENKESDPVELKNMDVLDFGIDILNETDRKLIFRKVSALVYISPSFCDSSPRLNNNNNSGIFGSKSRDVEKIKRTRNGAYSDPGMSIYAYLEDELSYSREESKRLQEMSDSLNNVKNILDAKNKKAFINEDFQPLKKLDEQQLRGDRLTEGCTYNLHVEKNESRQQSLYNEKESILGGWGEELDGQVSQVEKRVDTDQIIKKKDNEIATLTDEKNLLVGEILEYKHEIAMKDEVIQNVESRYKKIIGVKDEQLNLAESIFPDFAKKLEERLSKLEKANVKIGQEKEALDILNQQMKDTISIIESQLELLEESDPQMTSFVSELGRLNGENGASKLKNKNLNDENAKLSSENEQKKTENAKLRLVADRAVTENDDSRKGIELERIRKDLQVEFERKVEQEVAKRVEVMLSSVQKQNGNLSDRRISHWNNGNRHQRHTKKSSEPTKDSEWTGENENELMDNGKTVNTRMRESNRNDGVNCGIESENYAINSLPTSPLTKEKNHNKTMSSSSGIISNFDIRVTTVRHKEVMGASDDEEKKEAKTLQDGCRHNIKGRAGVGGILVVMTLLFTLPILIIAYRLITISLFMSPSPIIDILPSFLDWSIIILSLWDSITLGFENFLRNPVCVCKSTVSLIVTTFGESRSWSVKSILGSIGVSILSCCKWMLGVNKEDSEINGAAWIRALFGFLVLGYVLFGLCWVFEQCTKDICDHQNIRGRDDMIDDRGEQVK